VAVVAQVLYGRFRVRADCEPRYDNHTSHESR